MSRKRFGSALALILCGALLSGCWDRIEINDEAFVVGTAIDRVEQGYQASVLIPLPGNIGGPAGGEGSGKRPFTVQSEIGSTPREAFDKMQRKLSRRLSLAHRRVLLFGEDVVKDNVEPLMDSNVRISEARLNTLVAVTRGKAVELLGAEEQLERFPVEAMREILQSEATIRILLKDIVYQLNAPGLEAMFPYLEIVEGKTGQEKTEEIRAAGYVITKQGKSVGILQGEQAEVMRFFVGRFRPFKQTIQTDSGAITLYVSGATKEIKPYLKGNQIHFKIRVNLQANIVEDFTQQESFSFFEKVWSRKFHSDIVQMLDTLQQKQSDVIGFGQMLRRKYPMEWKTKWEPVWPDVFSKAHMEVEVKTNIDRVGMIRQNLLTEEDENEG